MRAFLVVVLTPILQFFLRVCKAQEPVRVETFCPEATVEGFDESVIGGFAGPAEIERDPSPIGAGEGVSLEQDGVSLLQWRSGGSNTPTIRRLIPSCRHQLSSIAPFVDSQSLGAICEKPRAASNSIDFRCVLGRKKCLERGCYATIYTRCCGLGHKCHVFVCYPRDKRAGPIAFIIFLIAIIIGYRGTEAR